MNKAHWLLEGLRARITSFSLEGQGFFQEFVRGAKVFLTHVRGGKGLKVRYTCKRGQRSYVREARGTNVLRS